ncbi:ATP-binding protein [Robertmurraya sp. DFI.2.37]|uniref:ATP-binding protein n=1 Tax=Robertmurraya sp. DFI.2.37 TaxID=3031819 RepID=UPI0023D98825|nr:ATP-binding protein [Robertmurraya sp. DFI.2.37]MDF1510004.1 ATP-binding protein [Robertmurraya sp. DFI.2.37]
MKNLQASYTENDEIQLFFTFNEEFLIESDKATVIALIVNELVQNCYDHAFKGLEKGEIIVDVQKQNEIVTINVQDNGVGFIYTEEIEKSLGFSIVQSYVRDKLRGKLGITKREKGTDVFFRFTV